MAKITLHQLGDRLRRRRQDRGVRDVAKEIGISPATLSRVERGYLPDLETFAKICDWMKIDPAAVLGIRSPESRRTKRSTASPTVTAHFRADQTISPTLAKALADLILAAQQKLRTESS